MAAKDTTLGEHLGAVWAEIWFVSCVFSQMDSHVATLGEGAIAAVDKALECSLVPVCLGVQYSNGLTHLFRDGFEALLPIHFLIFIFTLLWLDIIKANPVFKCILSCVVIRFDALLD